MSANCKLDQKNWFIEGLPHLPLAASERVGIKEKRKNMRNFGNHKPIATGTLLAGLMMMTSAFANAHIIPKPCDFATGGGFVIDDSNDHANFGLVAGCSTTSSLGT